MASGDDGNIQWLLFNGGEAIGNVIWREEDQYY